MTVIVAGIRGPGAQVPPVRQLARDLGIAPNTVVRMYEELARGGWIAAEPHRGIVVVSVRAEMVERERLGQTVAELLRVARQLRWDANAVRADIERQVRAEISDGGTPQTRPDRPWRAIKLLFSVFSYTA